MKMPIQGFINRAIEMPLFLLLLLMLLTGCASSKVKAVNAADTGEGKAQEVDKISVSTFVLGIGDSLDIIVFRHDDLKKSVKIDPPGIIMFPLIGDVTAVGKDIFQLRDEMQKSLSKYLVDPQVTITVTAVQSQKVMVLGEVSSPGIFTLETELSIMEAITKAGGMTNNAEMSNVLLIRRNKNKPDISSLDLKKAIKKGDLSQNKILQGGDIIYLPAVKIADVSWYFTHLGKILSPIVNLESGIVLWPQVVDVLEGKNTSSTFAIPTQ